MAVTFLTFNQNKNEQPTGLVVAETSGIEPHFCPPEDCSAIMASKLSIANKSIHCALYNFGDDRLIKVFDNKRSKIDVKVFSDNNYADKLGYLQYVRFDTKDSLMHNKFCVIDDAITITGSFNPVTNAKKDKNNIVIIRSRALAQNYEDEFNELRNYEKNTKNRVSSFSNGKIENYFCPEDSCAAHLIDKIKAAKKSIRFLVYSFTDREIANALVEKANEGVRVSGVFENSQLSDSVHDLLEYQGIDVRLYEAKGLLHDKVFIIDGSVVTGSYNPTNNGNRANDENMLIINDQETALKFSDEFNSIYRNLNK
jgi:phosphatidylserine/phosphatidylglycerophosphate/cardiolipin synthase-like enzyme